MSVRDYIRAELERTPSGTDINVVASNWLRSVPRDELPLIVHEMAVMVTRHEKTAHGGYPTMQLASPAAQRSQGEVHESEAVEERSSVGKSWRERLAPHQAWLNKCRSVDGTLWRLGDMTADMLRLSAARRRTHATTVLDNAAHDEKIAAALDEHGATKVDELPDPVVLALFEEAEA